jgi:hypothetical protein
MKEKIEKWYKQGLWSAPMVRQAVEKGVLTATTGERRISLRCDLTARQRNILLSGGLLRYIGEGGL